MQHCVLDFLVGELTKTFGHFSVAQGHCMYVSVYMYVLCDKIWVT